MEIRIPEKSNYKLISVFIVGVWVDKARCDATIVAIDNTHNFSVTYNKNQMFHVIFTHQKVNRKQIIIFYIILQRSLE